MIGGVEADWGSARLPVEELRLTVLAVVADGATRALLPRVITSDRLVLASDVPEGIVLAEAEVPDVAFVDVGLGDGAGLAMVHHLKALVPDTTVFALATKQELEAAAHAVGLGGAGLFLMPLGGDEVLNAVNSVRVRLAERAVRAQLEHESMMSARAAGWILRIAELADARDRNAAAQLLAEVLLEATGAAGVAVYLVVGERTTELTRAAASAALERAPAFGSEVDVLEYARREQLVVVPLAGRKVAAGHALLLPQATSELSRPGLAESARSSGLSSDGAPASGTGGGDGSRSAERPSSESPSFRRPRPAPLLDGLVKLLAAQAAVGLALLGERDRASGGAAMKDPSSSAYSFAYYVDVAGREIDKAKRYGRRFTIATIVLGPAGPDGAPPAPALDPAEVADQLLNAVRDTDILARVEENEFQLLMPETAGLDAHACYRRVVARLADMRAGYLPAGVLVGVATFPHDGQGLAQLLRIARRRAEATKESVVHQISPDQRSVSDLLEILTDAADAAPGAPFTISAPRALELALPEAVTLATSVVKSALRGGATFIAVAHHPGLSLGAAVRAATGPPREDVVMHALDVRSSPGCDDIEALCVLAEHGAYVFIGRSRGGLVRGVHAADPLLADLLAERLGRAAGLRVFG